MIFKFLMNLLLENNRNRVGLSHLQGRKKWEKPGGIKKISIDPKALIPLRFLNSVLKQSQNRRKIFEFVTKIYDFAKHKNLAENTIS